MTAEEVAIFFSLESIERMLKLKIAEVEKDAKSSEDNIYG